MPPPPPQQLQIGQKEGRLALAASVLQTHKNLSVHRVSALYNTPRSTLRGRLAGALPQAAANARKRKLLPVEEQSLVRWILDLDSRGFPPHIIDVRRMADTLLAARGQQPPPPRVGKCWVTRFINSQPELETKWDRKLHSQRALCQDPVKFRAWFKLVEGMRQKYGILDEDIYNFDETGFMMGIASGMSKVVTSSDRVGRANTIQPGNRDWVTTIECINASGWALSPLIILPGKLHQASWYRDIPDDWTLAVSDNGWTTDELGFSWLKHFDNQTASRTTGAYRLLIVDGHSSHATPEFDQYCAEHKIISLCMPAHSSHLLQPLDVSCFSPLKTAYGGEVSELARAHIYHVDKQDFLSIYTRIRPRLFTEQTIKSSFQAAGLVPHCPDRVLSSLTVVRTPSPPAQEAHSETRWSAETPHTVAQLQQQAQLIHDRLGRQSQSPTSQAIAQLVKGCQIAMHSATILAEENTKLRHANDRRERKKRQRRQYIATGGTLTGQEGRRLAAEADRVVEVDAQAQASQSYQRAPPTCSKCHERGHRRTQCRSN